MENSVDQTIKKVVDFKINNAISDLKQQFNTDIMNIQKQVYSIDKHVILLLADRKNHYHNDNNDNDETTYMISIPDIPGTNMPIVINIPSYTAEIEIKLAAIANLMDISKIYIYKNGELHTRIYPEGNCKREAIETLICSK